MSRVVREAPLAPMSNMPGVGMTLTRDLTLATLRPTVT
jgi:hypothetical protein